MLAIGYARTLAVAAVTVTLTGALLVPAGAEVVEGTCTGTATMDGELVIDADEPGTRPVEIPSSGTVGFAGSFERDGDDIDERPYRGELRGGLPLGSWVIASWSGRSTTAEAVGTESYQVPNFIPQGSGPIPLELEVTFGDDTCRIVGAVAVAGPRWDVITLTMLVVTLLLLAATVAAGRRDARGKGRPLVGLLAGLFGGLTGAAMLFGSGAIALDSIVWWVAPLVLAAVGLLLGAAAPFGRRQDPVPVDAPGGGAGSGPDGE